MHSIIPMPGSGTHMSGPPYSPGIWDPRLQEGKTLSGSLQFPFAFYPSSCQGRGGPTFVMQCPQTVQTLPSSSAQMLQPLCPFLVFEQTSLAPILRPLAFAFPIPSPGTFYPSSSSSASSSHGWLLLISCLSSLSPPQRSLP